MEVEKILELEDNSIETAVFQPVSSVISKKIFNLMHSTIGSCFITAGMDGSVIAIDQDKMERMAERRSIDLVRYEIPLRKFTSAYLRRINMKD